jgi:hypothetical protein
MRFIFVSRSAWRRTSAVTFPLSRTALVLALFLCGLSSAPAFSQGIEDEAIPDEVPALEPEPQPQPNPQVNPAPVASPTAAPAGLAVPAPTESKAETVTVPRAVWEQLLRDVEELKRARPAVASPTAPVTTTPPTVEAPEPSTEAPAETVAAPSGGEEGKRNYLLLPDISFIGNVRGVLSSDRRDEERGSLRLSEGEIGIQGSVYPNVNATAYLVAAPGEDEPLGIEEGYLSFLGARKNLSVLVGRKFVPFGRTGEQHPHSWLYARQLLPRRNIIAGENLVGDGVLLRYLLPTGRAFTHLDVGLFNGEGAGEVSADPFGDALPSGPGAGFTQRFASARLWSGIPLGASQELELGASYARGRSQIDDDSGATLGEGRNTLSGFDVSYRRFGTGDKRLLLRGEYFRSTPYGGLAAAASRASGYYGLANYRFSKRADLGLLYENSGFPQAPGSRESATSLIYTRRYNEQFYIRAQATRGDSPGQGSYTQAVLQFVFGIGPHSHNLE